MFFVSEEFLRSYEAGEDFEQTIDEAVPQGTGLFEGEYASKASTKSSKSRSARKKKKE